MYVFIIPTYTHTIVDVKIMYIYVEHRYVYRSLIMLEFSFVSVFPYWNNGYETNIYVKVVSNIVHIFIE